MTLMLCAAIGLLVLLFGGGLVWVRFLAPNLEDADQVAIAPAVAIVYFGALTAVALSAPWSFQATAIAGVVVWVGGALVVGYRWAFRGLSAMLRRSWALTAPVALGFLAVAGFGAVQGDPGHVVAFPGTLVSARVTNLPPDHLFPVGAAQVLQHKRDFTKVGSPVSGWDLSDRTPLAGAVTASVLSGMGTTLPRRMIWRHPRAETQFRGRDSEGYWVARLVLVLLNAFVIVGVGRLALSIFGMRAAAIAGFLAAANPYVFTHMFFTWPKMLAAYFVLLHFVFVRERRMPAISGAFAGLAYLAHPLAALFVVPSLIVVAARGLRRGLPAFAGVVGVILPWQVWTIGWAHPSRLLTYPLGYTMRDPNRLGHELRVAWRQFNDAGGLAHALHVRYDEVVGTFLPLYVARNFATLPAGCDCITNAEIWFTLHDRTIPGLILFAMCPFAVYGTYGWWRKARWEPVWMLAAPFLLALAFWGVSARGLGADLLQPMSAVLVVTAAGGLAAARRPLALLGVALAIVEAATVVWWGLYSELPGTGVAALALACMLWLLPCALLVSTVLSNNPTVPSRNQQAAKLA